MTIDYKLLNAKQSELLCSGIREVYGETYPIPEFYDAHYIQTAITSGKLHTVAAINSDHKVIGSMSTVLEQVGDFTADGSALMISEEYRGQGIVAKLGEKMVNSYNQLGLSGLHLYALALHDLVQNQSQKVGAVVTGILPGYFYRKANIAGYDYPDARIGAVAIYMPLASLPTRVCYLPDIYDDVLRATYQRLDINRKLINEDNTIPIPSTTCFGIDAKSANKHLRIMIQRIGADLSKAIQKYLIPNNSERYEVTYLDIPLCDPAAAYAVKQARELGFFYGALMVDRRGSDQLRLQRYDETLVAPEAMVIASADGRALLNFILSDSKTTKPGNNLTQIV